MRLEDISASLCLVDWYTAGRGDSQDGNWRFDSFRNDVTVSIGASGAADVIYRDVTHLRGGDALARQMYGFNTVASVFLCGPRVATTVARLLDAFNGRRANKPREFIHDDTSTDSTAGTGSVGMFVDGMILSVGQGPIRGSAILRLVSHTMEQAARFLSGHLGCMDGFLHQDPFDGILRIRTCDLEASVAAAEAAAFHGEERSPELCLDVILDPPAVAPCQPDRHSAQPATHDGRDSEPEDMPGHKPLAAPSPDPDGARVAGTLGGLAANLTMWQLVDSCLPTGGFAHSAGLEAALQLGMLTAYNDVVQYIWSTLLQTATLLLPFVAAAHRLAGQEQDAQAGVTTPPWADAVGTLLLVAAGFVLAPPRGVILLQPLCLTRAVLWCLAQWVGLDRQLAACITCSVSRRASTTQGTSLLRAAAAAFPEVTAAIKAIKSRVMAAQPPGGTDPNAPMPQGHLAACHGAVCGLLHLSEQDACHMFLFVTMRDMVSAAVRLNIVGPLKGGAMQRALSLQMPDLLQKTAGKTWEQAHQVAPLLSVVAGAHDRLYSRMFNS